MRGVPRNLPRRKDRILQICTGHGGVQKFDVPSSSSVLLRSQRSLSIPQSDQAVWLTITPPPHPNCSSLCLRKESETFLVSCGNLALRYPTAGHDKAGRLDVRNQQFEPSGENVEGPSHPRQKNKVPRRAESAEITEYLRPQTLRAQRLKKFNLD